MHIRDIGAKLEVLRQYFRTLSKFHDQDTKAAHARGPVGMPPRKILNFSSSEKAELI